jgi:bifunctional enzyme CysN/CysC
MNGNGSTGSADRKQMNIVIAGHVDHGKSTVIGRMLADTGSLPEGKLEQIKHQCEINSKPFEYAFLLDALKHEQSQGITIDSARVFFHTKARDYIIIDAPGHIEFLKNMVSGAARAEAAFLVIDAEEGIQENSRRHGYMLSMLGIKQICVLVNKMDLADYSKVTFKKITRKFSRFLRNLDIYDVAYIPVSGIDGVNIASRSKKTDWYEGPTVLEQLDRFEKEKDRRDKPFRMPVQDVYKFTRYGDKRRIIAGFVESGTLNIGDEVCFYPSGKKSRVKTIEAFNSGQLLSVPSGYSTGFTTEEQIFVTRGQIAVKTSELKPRVASLVKVNLFWLGKNPVTLKKEYTFKLGTIKVPARVEEITRVIDASSLDTQQKKDIIELHDVAECTIRLGKAIAFDVVDDIPHTSRFVIVDDYEIRGGGIVREPIEDIQSKARRNILIRNYNWQPSHISPQKRAARYSQRATLILVTGQDSDAKKAIAERLEERLFTEGKLVYFIGIGNILSGVSADVTEEKGGRTEQVRRLAEVAHLFLDAGMILIVTAVELTEEDLELVRFSITPDRIETIWVGDKVTTDIACDLQIMNNVRLDEAMEKINDMLIENKIIFHAY